MEKTELEEILENIDKDKMVQLALDMTSISSPTGKEKEMATFMYNLYREMGLKAMLQEIEPERYNALGILRGDGSGATLMFNGHMDTSYSGEEPGLPDLPGYKPTGLVKDGWIYGLGVANMKCALACYATAVEAIQKSGIKLKGDVLVAAVAGEVEMGPVDEYQGPHYRGGGAGSLFLATHGGLADMCVLGEPTSMKLVSAHMGFVYTKITVYGEPAHSAYADRAVNAIRKMLKVIQAIDEWTPKYRKAHRLGQVDAGVNLAAIRGGLPYRGSRTPYFCSLYVDCRQIPGQKPMEVKHEIEGIMRRLKEQDPELRYEVEPYMSVPGVKLDQDEYLFQAVKRAHKTVLGEDPEIVTRRVYDDDCLLTLHGIPSITYGPGGITVTGVESWDPSIGEHVSIQKMYECTKVYVAMILDVCMQDSDKILKKS